MEDWIWQAAVLGGGGGAGVVGWIIRQQSKLREDFAKLSTEVVTLRAEVQHMPDRAALDRWTDRLGNLEGDYKAQAVHLKSIDRHLGDVAENLKSLLQDWRKHKSD